MVPAPRHHRYPETRESHFFVLIMPTVLEELHVNVQLEHLLPLLRVGIESTSPNDDALCGVDSISTR